MARLFGLLLAGLGALAAAGSAGAQHAPHEPPDSVPDLYGLDAESWREDLRFLADRIPRQHPAPWHDVSRQEFDAALEQLSSRLPALDYPQILAGIVRLVALLGEGDGHSRVRLEPPFIRGLYPLRLWWFSDGLYVVSAAPEFVNLVGKRVVWFGGEKTEDAVERLRPLAHGDNEFHQRLNIPILMLMPEIVEGVGLAEERDRLNIVVEDELGGQASAVLTPVPFPEGEHRVPDLAYDPLRLGAPADWPAMWAPGDSRPLYLRDPENWYWFQFLPDSRTLYLQFNVVGDKESGESVETFIERALAAAERGGAERLVLDLRLNGGGNNFLARPIWYRLVGSERWREPGRLFVIIGRRTFSAAQNLATILDEHTPAVFVGEPSGGKPNAYGDARSFRLPNSRLRVSISTLYWQDAMPWDDRPWIAPDLVVELSSADFQQGRDPALDAILALPPGATFPSLSERLRAAYGSGGIAAAVEAYRVYKADPAHRYEDTESTMNDAGYFLLRNGRVEEAIEVFRLNVEAYPDSWNVYDSLGEAYLEAGEREAAMDAYEKSLEMNPDNENAVNILNDLRRGQETAGQGSG